MYFSSGLSVRYFGWVDSTVFWNLLELWWSNCNLFFPAQHFTTEEQRFWNIFSPTIDRFWDSKLFVQKYLLAKYYTSIVGFHQRTTSWSPCNKVWNCYIVRSKENPLERADFTLQLLMFVTAEKERVMFIKNIFIFLSAVVSTILG